MLLGQINKAIPKVQIKPSKLTNGGFPDGSDGKEPACNVGDPGLIPGLGKSPGGELPTPVFCSILYYIGEFCAI